MIPNAPFIVLSGPALLERAAAVPEQGLVLNEVWAEGDRDPIPLLRATGSSPGTWPGRRRSRGSSRSSRRASPSG